MSSIPSRFECGYHVPKPISSTFRGSGCVSAKVRVPCKIFAAVSEKSKDELKAIIGKKFMDIPFEISVISRDKRRADQQRLITLQ